MKITEPDIELNSILRIDRIERWNVYNRLKQLAIPCVCRNGQPLQVEVKTAGAAILLWSVIQQFTAPRSIVVDHLERCWRQQLGSQYPNASP